MEPPFLREKAVLVQERSDVMGRPVLHPSMWPQSSAHGLKLHGTRPETLLQAQLLPSLSTTVPSHSLFSTGGRGHMPSQVFSGQH